MEIKDLLFHLIQVCQLEGSKDEEDKSPTLSDISLELILIAFVNEIGHDCFLDLLCEYEDDIESRQLMRWYSNYLIQK